MITIRGSGGSAGVAAGPLSFYRRSRAKIPRIANADFRTEWRRFKAAQKKAVKQLGALAEKARVEVGGEAAFLFETHQLMAQDPEYEKAVEEALQSGLNIEAVLTDVRDLFADMFDRMDDAYMRARAADVKDVSDRLIGILTDVTQGGVDSDGPIVLAADDLAPSETIQLDRSKILAFITEGGSGASHTAILARTMGIPAVVGVGDQLKSEYAGREVIVDGGTGVAVLEPDAATRARLIRKREAECEEREALDRLKGKENVTRDGQRVRICCNIGTPDDVPAVLKNDGEGVGLFRSEFLYLGRNDFPSEDEQFAAYRKVLSDMGGREVVVRTLDIGADKQARYFNLPHEENPALGSRALRVCLSRPEIFRTQLRALYRASAFGQLRILFPMVASVWEVREAKMLCEQVKRELDSEGVVYSRDVPLGVMIETPAAALVSDRLAREVDFFSCGTNDLTQYTLACDRQNSDLDRFFDPRHPAVLRLLKLVTENAHRNGVRVGVCGESTADLRLTETFLALGIDELSVAPSMVLPLRRKVRETDVSQVRGALLDDLMGDRTGAASP